MIALLLACSSKSEGIRDEEVVATENQGNSADGETYYITHYNVIFAPDLSNRVDPSLYPRSLDDRQILDVLLDNIYPRILNYKRSSNQLDEFSMSFVNQKLASAYGVEVDKLNIDFGKFGHKQLERIDYIKGRSESTLEKDVTSFTGEFEKVYSSAVQQTFGADIWTFLNSGVDNLMLKSAADPRFFNGKTYVDNYRNVLVLLTDGYLEAGLYGSKACPETNRCYYLSKEKVDGFRSAFLKSGEKDMKAFFEKNNYGIVPVNNPQLQHAEILVLEMYDRSLSKGGSATVHPSDMEILQLFWTDWLEASGVKRYELRPALSTKEETERVILNFMGVK
ncbi:MAG: hypothetical protein ACLFUB_09415 [Cyclobacteriaceae bacterium]